MGTCGIGMECAAALCSKDGPPSPAPSPPSPPEDAPTCDLSNCFGPDITGNGYWFTFNVNGNYIFLSSNTKYISF